jgi:hypothetical protein
MVGRGRGRRIRAQRDTTGSMSDEWKAFFATSLDPCFLIGVHQDGALRRHARS